MSKRPVAFVTGAAHGQGRATSLALAKEGYNIVALDVAAPLAYPGYAMGTSAELDSLAAECAGECLTVVADVRDDAAVASAVAEANERFGCIDVLFNNAGICAYGLAHELTEAEWDTMLDINLKGPWLVARHVIPHMIEAKRGVIVNNSSIAGLRGMGRLSHYAASKWGLTGPHEVLGDRARAARDPRGLDPPDRGRHASERRPRRARGPDRARGRGTVRRKPAPGALDRGAGRRRGRAFLVSDRARYLTGTTFVIDAGLLTA